MMNSSVPSVELITLSDSLTLPAKRKQSIGDQGATKIVCIDSDTESDGSFAQAIMSKETLKATTIEFCHEISYTSNTGSERWLGLHVCSEHSKRLGEDHSPSSTKELQKDLHAMHTAIRHREGISNAGLDAITKRSTKNVECTDDSLCSTDNVDSPKANHLSLKPDKSCSGIDLWSPHGPVTSPDQCLAFGTSHVCNSIMVPDSYEKVERPLSPSALVELPDNDSPCLSSAGKDSAKFCSPSWDDHLRDILAKLESSKAVPLMDNCFKPAHEQERHCEYLDHDSDDELYHEDYSFLKNIHRKCDAGGAVARGEQDPGNYVKETSKWGSCELDELSSKATAKTNGGSTSLDNSISDSVGASDKDVAKLSVKEKRTKGREEKEAKKQQLKLARELSRKDKQEEKRRQQELRKLRTEEEKKRKEILKAEAAERRKLEKEKEKWEKGKFALQNITALVDTEILEAGLIGGHLLTRFAEKNFKYHLVKNSVKRTVIWQMKLVTKESQIDLQEECLSQESSKSKLSKNVGSQLSLEFADVPYVLVVLEASEFLEMITNDTLDSHIRNLQKTYPGFTLCYLINRLMGFLQKRERQQYKSSSDTWQRPPVEQILAKLLTSYDGVHSRLCVDEAEVSEHIVGLTRSLAECPFKRKLTPLSLSANGDHMVKNDPCSDAIKKDVWLKALVALPKVSGSCAIAISQKYPSMSALFEAYLDPLKTVYEKECLLKDLVKEGLLGTDHNRRIGPVCSKRIFRILMAEQGSLLTDDVEEGADAFRD